MMNPPSPPRAPGGADFMQRMRESAEAAISEPYRGITSGGVLMKDLFPLRATSFPTKAIREAADAFLAVLPAEQRAQGQFPIDSDMWRRWSNIHRAVMRHGTQFGQMTVVQRARAYDLLRASLSATGFQTARDIMRLNETLAELTGEPAEYGEAFYWLSILGQPSDDQPWGWQIDGHHLNLNFFVLGDQVVMTPAFMGSEIVYAEAGRYVGTRVLEDEEVNGLALVRSLSDAQRTKAILSSELPRDMFTSAFRDNFELGFEGIAFGELAGQQQELFVKLLETYVCRLRPGHSDIWMNEIKAHLSDTHLVWMGGVADDSVFYYRLHSPVVLIEFDHQRGVALRTEQPTKLHVHTVVRTPNGNDYGKDLLRQHHERFDHSHAGGLSHQHN